MSGLFLVQTVCKGYQQRALVGKELNIQEPITTLADNIFSELSLNFQERFDLTFHLNCLLNHLFELSTKSSTDKSNEMSNLILILKAMTKLKDAVCYKLFWRFKYSS